MRRREPRSDRGQNVPLRCRVVSGHEADPSREQRQRTLPLGGEHAFGGELGLQPLDSGEVLSEPEALDRKRAQAEVASRLEQLGPAEHVHALAVHEREP